MKKGFSRVLLVSICAVLVLSMLSLVVGCSASLGGAKEGKVLKVGMILPATGQAAEKGKPGGDAVKDAMEYVNKELNGANGYQIQISWRDSNYDAAKVATIVNDFMNEGDLLFTTMSSKEMTAAQEIANRAGFPGIVTFAAPNNTNPPAHIYSYMPDYGDDWVSFVNYYLKNIWKGSGKPKMALLLLNNTTGSSVKDIADAKATSMGIDIVAAEEHKTDTISEMESLTRVKSKNPDVIFIASTPQPTSVILKNAKDLGMLTPNLTIGLGHAALDTSLINLAGADVVEGVYGTYPTVTWNDKAPGIAKLTEYVKKNNPSDFGNMSYLSMWTTSLVVAEVFRTAVKNVGYDAIAKGDANAWKAVEQSGIQKLKGYAVEGLQGPVSYTQGSNKLGTYVKIYQIKGGSINPVTDWIEAK
jgi:branched-chain amino acid transport system substrate-binding protein